MSFTTNTVSGGHEDMIKFYLQTWNSIWVCYANVGSLEDIESGDKLTVVKITSKQGCKQDNRDVGESRKWQR